MGLVVVITGPHALFRLTYETWHATGDYYIALLPLQHMGQYCLRQGYSAKNIQLEQQAIDGKLRLFDQRTLRAATIVD